VELNFVTHGDRACLRNDGKPRSARCFDENQNRRPDASSRRRDFARTLPFRSHHTMRVDAQDVIVLALPGDRKSRDFAAICVSNHGRQRKLIADTNGAW
jgi:hypothetical protein